MTSITDGNFQVTPPPFTTVYAKGIGIIYTESIDPPAPWEIKTYSFEP